MSIEEVFLFRQEQPLGCCQLRIFFCGALLSSPIVSRVYDGVDVSETVTDRRMRLVLTGRGIEFCSIFKNYGIDALVSSFLHLNPYVILES